MYHHLAVISISRLSYLRKAPCKTVTSHPLCALEILRLNCNAIYSGVKTSNPFLHPTRKRNTLACNDSRARSGVARGHRVVDVDHDARVRRLVSAREGHAGECLRPTAGNGNLSATIAMSAHNFSREKIRDALTRCRTGRRLRCWHCFRGSASVVSPQLGALAGDTNLCRAICSTLKR